jgi:hypothetical protein
MIKEVPSSGGGNDALDFMAYDMTIKEPSGIIYQDTSSVGIEPFNITGNHYFVELSQKDPQSSEIEKVFRYVEQGSHPFIFDFDYDILVTKQDEGLSIFQRQTQDGANFIAQSSLLWLRSQGKHRYNENRHMVDYNIETLTNMVVSTGVPMYGQGRFLHLLAAGFISLNGETKRFGLELLLGLSGKEGISTANKNHFTLDGKVYKLGAVDIVKGMAEDFSIQKVLSFQSRKEEEINCSLEFSEKFQMRADVNAIVVKVDEQYSQGFISGTCSQASTPITLEQIDTLLIYDQSVY